MPSEHEPRHSPGATADGDVRVVASKALPRESLGALLSAHDAALATGEGVLKKGRRTAVTAVRLGHEPFCVKEYHTSGVLDWVKDRLRGPRADLAWRSAAHLAAHGIATPEAVAVVERGGTRFFISRLIEGGVPLDRLLLQRFGGPPTGSELGAKRTMLRQLGRWLRRVHDCGIYHNDWSIKNIMTVERDGQWAFYLLDLESVTFYKRLTYRRRVKNLAQLSDVPFGITRTDRMRFYRAYNGGDPSLLRGPFLDGVLAAAQRRAERSAPTWARLARIEAEDKESDSLLRGPRPQPQ